MGSIHGDNVLVGHEQQRSLASIAFEARHNAVSPGYGFEDFRLDACILYHTFEIMRDLRFIPWRVLSINPNQLCKKVDGIVLCLSCIECGHLCKASQGKQND